jgi:hypothetical protein
MEETTWKDNYGPARPPCSGMLSIASQNYIYVMFSSYECALEDDDLGLP